MSRVGINWDDYESLDPGAWGLLQDLPRRDARAAFKKLMNEKAERIEAVCQLLKANHVELSDDDAGIQALNDWFVEHVEPDPGKPGRLLPRWYAVVNDIGLFLGDVLIGRCHGLRWEFYIWGKKNVSYHRHVIMGFRVPDPKYNIDFDRAVATHGHRIVSRLYEPRGEFLRWIKNAEAKA